MKKEYDVCEGYSKTEIKIRVDKALSEGWMCLGGIAVSQSATEQTGRDFTGLIFHQAIMRETRLETKEIPFGNLTDEYVSN
jgi:hypothetical protein